MKNFFSLILIIILNFSTVLSQKRILAKADKMFEHQEYVLAIEIYENYLKKNSSNIGATRRLAFSYKENNQHLDAIFLYEIIIQSPKSLPEDFLNYAEVLQKNQEYEKANIWFQKYLVNFPKNRKVRNHTNLEEIENLKKKKKENKTYPIYNLDINTPFSEFSPTYYGAGIVFVSSRKKKNKSINNYGRTGEPFLDLFFAMQIEKNKFGDVYNFSKVLNTQYHEGTASFTRDNRKIYFTRNNFRKGKIKLSKDKKHKLEIYVSQLIGDKWEEAELFTINDVNFSIGHPSLSHNQKFLFFSSDANWEGAMGGADIYVCRKLGTQWTKPKNLGPKINTSGDELFPFIHKDNILYFSSDGHGGLGSLDIFMCRHDGYQGSLPININQIYPINSSYDDFSFIIDAEKETGLFASNREGGKGGDDIYYFERDNTNLRTLKGFVYEQETGIPINKAKIILTDISGGEKIFSTKIDGKFEFQISPNTDYQLIISKLNYKTKKEVYMSSNYKDINEPFLNIPLEKTFWLLLKGTVIDEVTKKPIESAQIDVQNKSYNIKNAYITNQKGEFEFSIDPDCLFEFIVSKEGYFNKHENNISTYGKRVSETIYYDIELSLRQLKMGTSFVLNDIYYDLNKWNLRPVSKIELDKVVKYLQDNPHITVELGSHTDSRASNSYNLTLSQKRAQSAVNYIVSKGIAKSRITAKGYGESKLRNRCKDGVNCSEEEHQENRRTEIKVLGY